MQIGSFNPNTYFVNESNKDETNKDYTDTEIFLVNHFENLKKAKTTTGDELTTLLENMKADLKSALDEHDDDFDDDHTCDKELFDHLSTDLDEIIDSSKDPKKHGTMEGKITNSLNTITFILEDLGYKDIPS
ncbi:MAG: hypothetical protein ACOYK9_05340 [Chlamydiia bacterium]